MRSPARIVLLLVVVLGALVMFFPFLWTFTTSISGGAGLTATPQLIPDNPSWSAYLVLFERTPFARVIGLRRAPRRCAPSRSPSFASPGGPACSEGRTGRRLGLWCARAQGPCPWPWTC